MSFDMSWSRFSEKIASATSLSNKTFVKLSLLLCSCWLKLEENLLKTLSKACEFISNLFNVRRSHHFTPSFYQFLNIFHMIENPWLCSIRRKSRPRNDCMRIQEFCYDDKWFSSWMTEPRAVVDYVWAIYSSPHCNFIRLTITDANRWILTWNRSLLTSLNVFIVSELIPRKLVSFIHHTHQKKLFLCTGESLIRRNWGK